MNKMTIGFDFTFGSLNAKEEKKITDTMKKTKTNQNIINFKNYSDDFLINFRCFLVSFFFEYEFGCYGDKGKIQLVRKCDIDWTERQLVYELDAYEYNIFKIQRLNFIDMTLKIIKDRKISKI